MSEPEWGSIGREVFDRTYSRTKADGTKEGFREVVERMVDGNLALVPAEHQYDGERDDLLRLVGDLKVVPAGRHWWVSGVPGRQFLFSCHRAGWTDRLSDHVGFTFDELMKGGGVGANYSHDYMARMPRVQRRVYVSWHCKASHPDYEEMTDVDDDWIVGIRSALFVVPDSREGWVDALRYLCDLAYQEGPEIRVVFDVSDVRPRGSLIRGFGGTASGPAPLVQMLHDVGSVLRGVHQTKERRVRGLDAMDIDHAIASCVVAGNVRRSARMSMMHWQDPDIFKFIELKRNGGHWTTNMSVEVDDIFWSIINRRVHDADEYVVAHAFEVFNAVVKGMLSNGEPGLYNSSLAARGEEGDVRCSNPCGEITLEEWENCNLGSVNLALIESREELDLCLELMARWLLRATFADGMCYAQKKVVERNRRIGVGIMGFQEWLWTFHRCTYKDVSSELVEHNLERMRDVVVLASDVYAKQLGVNAPIKHTTVAPTGTTAKLAGVTEGIHPAYAKHFIRRVRYASNHPTLPGLREQGHHVESDVVSKDTNVVSFVCADPILDRVPEDKVLTSDQLTVNQKLLAQRVVQRSWADNAVSYTVNVMPGTHPEILKAALREHGPRLKGTTVMVEGSYEQAPLERISREEYDAAIAKTYSSSAEECVGACPIK